MSRKLFGILLIMALMLSMVAGCGNTTAASTAASEETAAEVESTASEAEAPAAEAEEPAAEPDVPAAEPEAAASTEAEEAAPEIDVYPLGEGIELTAFCEFRSSDTGGLIDTRGDAFFLQHAAEVTGVSLKTTDISQQAFSENFNLLVASGDYPDLIFNVNSYYASGMDAAIDDEVLIDLEPYLADYAPNYYGLMESNPQTKKDTHTDTGRCGQFFCLENEAQNDGSGYFIRTDMLEQIGMEVPETLDEYHDVLIALKNIDGISYPMYVGSTGISAICNAYGVGGLGVGGGFGATDLNYVVKDGEVIATYFQEEYRTVLGIMNQWMEEGIYSHDYATLSTEVMPPDADYYAAITHGECALFSYTSNTTDLVKDALENDPAFAIEPTPTMVLNKGDKIKSTTVTTLVDSNGFGISTQCEQVEIAMRYLDWFYGEEGALCASYGIEGVTYELDADGNPQWTDFVLNNPDGLASNNIIYSYCVQNEVGNVDVHRQDYRKTEEQAAVSALWNENVDYEGAEGLSRYITMTAEESDIYTATISDIATYIAETIPKFVYGDLNLEDDYDEFLQTLTDMNIEECVSIKQDVYDRYQAR